MNKYLIVALIILILVVSYVSIDYYEKESSQITEIRSLSLIEYNWKTIKPFGTMQTNNGKVINVTGLEFVDYLELIIYNPNKFEVYPIIEGMDMRFKPLMMGQGYIDNSFIIRPGENRIIISESKNNLTKYLVFNAPNNDKAVLEFKAIRIECTPFYVCDKIEREYKNSAFYKTDYKMEKVVLRKVIDLPILDNLNNFDIAQRYREVVLWNT